MRSPKGGLFTLWQGSPLDEWELEIYLNNIEYLSRKTNVSDIDPYQDALIEQLWNEETSIPGCYRVLPAKVD